MKKFTRTIEDITCENCGFNMKGTGYTNHCKECLWSKHVDINPGDRAESCHGMMEPVSYHKLAGKERVIQRCQKCGFEKANKVEKEDNIDALLAIHK